MDDQHIIHIATDFSDAPGARYREDGEKSGQEFFEDLLEPKFKEAHEAGSKLTIIFDGAWGYATSFISEAFGRLSEKYGPIIILDVLVLISDEDPFLIDYVRDVIKDPNKHGG